MRALAAALVAVIACKGGKSKMTDQMTDQRSSVPPPVTRADAGAPVSELRLVGCQAAPPPPALDVKAPSVTVLPSVKLGALTVKGRLGKDEIAKALAEHQYRVQYCYEQRLVKEPAIADTVQLTITVEPNGRVFEAYTDKGHDEDLALCLKHIVSEAKFPAVSKAPLERTTVTVPMTFSWNPTPVKSHPAPQAWTPFAALPPARPKIADVAAATFPASLSLGKLDACLGTQKGSFRTMVAIGADGVVASARVGGLGNKAAEDCLAAALVGTKAQPGEQAAEVACDFQRGDATPWRMTPDAGYTVVEPGKEPAVDPSDATKTFLIVAQPDTQAAALDKALAVGARGAASLVALKADDGAPLFVAAGPGTSSYSDPSTPLVIDAADPVTVCGGLMDAPVAGPFEHVNDLLSRASRRCTHRPCPSQVVITTTGGRKAFDLAAFAGMARGLDFQRIVLGPGRCAVRPGPTSSRGG